MTDAAPSGNSSTPSTAAPAAGGAPAPATTQTPATPAAAPAATPTPSTAQPAPGSTDSTPATTAATATPAPAPDATTATAPASPTFTLPTDMQLAPEAVTKFTDFVKAKQVGADGKVTLSPQEIVDLFADQARTAATRWQTQMAQQDKAWEAESKRRFSAPQLAAAETGIGFLTSYEPAFRDLAKAYRNNPTFVNAMRIVGERLSEDTFERGVPAPTTAKRAAKDIMYPKRASN